MRLYVYPLLLLVLLSAGVNAQDTGKIDSLNTFLKNNPGNSKAKSSVYQELSDLYKEAEPEKSLQSGKLALLFAKQLNDTINVVNSLNKIGNAYLRVNNYYLATEFHLEALKLAEQVKYFDGQINSLLSIGSIYRLREKFDRASHYYFRALEICMFSENKQLIALTTSSIGNIYFDMDDYKNAIKYYDAAFIKFKAINDKKNEAYTCNNIASLYYTTEEFGKAIEYYQEALLIYKSLDNNYGTATTLYNLALIYFNQDNYAKATDNCKQSLLLAQKINSTPLLIQNYFTLSEIQQKTGNYKEALAYFRQYSDLNDQKATAQIDKNIDDAVIKYEAAKKEKENAYLKKERLEQLSLDNRQKKWLFSLAACLFVAASIVALILNNNLSKRKANKYLKELVDLKELEEIELRKAKNAAEENIKLKENFIANISHEIRTPLNAISGFSQLLLYEDDLNDTQREFIQHMLNASESLTAIVNDILDLSKIETGKAFLKLNPGNVIDTVNSTMALLKQKVDEKNIYLTLDVLNKIPESLLIDQTKLRQVLINLVGNSIKFTEKGGITIQVENILEDEDTATLGFKIRDTGIGIPSDKINYVFERFTQVEGGTTRKYGGTGLGLNIVKSLIELKGGTITATSELGAGTEFSFVIPFKKAKKVHSKTLALINERPAFKNLRILLVEDNAMNSKLVLSIFNNSGIRVDLAENGEIALGMLKDKTYDVILMDLQMPVMDGYETSKYIRENMSADIPIIAMTAHAMVGEKEKCMNSGMTDFIPKPFKVDDLLNAINHHTQNLTLFG